MKKLFLLLIFSSCIYKTEAQEFSGLGEIKIGMLETDFIAALEKKIQSKVKIVTSKNASRMYSEWTEYYLNKNVPIKSYLLSHEYKMLEWPSGTPSIIQKVSKIKGYKIYFLPVYKVGELKLPHVFVAISDNSVQFIETLFSSELVEVASQKYTPTETLDTSYKILCSYIVSGVKTEKTVTKKLITWLYPNLQVNATAFFDYDEKCKDVILSYIRFKSNKFSTDFADHLNAESLKIKNNKDKLQKSIVDDI